jgi:hypothetical protein
VGHQHAAEHLFGEALTSATDLTTRTPPLASGPRPFELALATATGVDLGLHDEHRTAQLFSGGHGLLDGEGGIAARDGSAELCEDGFGLVFVDVHEGPVSTTASEIVGGL